MTWPMIAAGGMAYPLQLQEDALGQNDLGGKKQASLQVARMAMNLLCAGEWLEESAREGWRRLARNGPTHSPMIGLG